MFHRLFDGCEEICLYPVDISVLYAYFPCFTGNVNLSETQLRTRLCEVIEKSLKGVSFFYLQNRDTSAKLIAKAVDALLSDSDLRDKSAVISSIRNVWAGVSNQLNDDVPFVFKETSQSVFFPYFKSKFPSLKMVSLIRDPRDNYSALRAGVENYYSEFGEGHYATLASVINRARMDLITANQNQKLYPDSFLAIKFEDLVSNTEIIMRKVTDFLNISFTKKLLTPTLEGELYLGNSHDGKTFSGISKENIGNWKSRISDKEARIIEYWLGDVMDIWSYEKEYTNIDGQLAFSEFYEWYNCKYFYHDSFRADIK